MTDEIHSPEPVAVATRTIAITGVSGLIGQRLLPLVEAIEGVERIVGLDAREPARRVSGLDFHLVDLVGGDLTGLFDGVDVVVHLAGILGPTPDAALAESVNLDGLRSVLAAAATGHVGHVIRTSSATAYGAWPKNQVPLDESSALRPNPGYQPAVLDAEAERLLGNWREEHPGTLVTCLRLAPVVGSGARSVFARAAVGRPPAVVRGCEVPTQVVHVDDVASAIAHVIEQRLDGAYNVAADGWLDHDDAVAVAPHRLPPAVPHDVAYKALTAMWGSGIGDAPPEVLPYVMYSWVVSTDKIKATGWTPRHTNEEAILLAGDPDARRQPLPWIAAVGAVLGGAAGATWWLSHRRRR